MIRRCKANPTYSLRSFARFLRVEPSALSKILNGKRGITERMSQRLAQRLGISPSEMEKLHHQSTTAEQTSQNEYKQLTLDYFQVISDWYHYALLELTQVAGFQGNPKWIARKLGITVSEVNMAVERLIRLEFLTIDQSGRWTDTAGAVTTIGNEFTTIAFRKLQRQILEKSIVALEEVDISQRGHSSMTMAVNSKMLPKANEEIKKFRRKICQIMQSEGPYDHVYNLGVSIYPITQTTNQEELSK